MFCQIVTCLVRTTQGTTNLILKTCPASRKSWHVFPKSCHDWTLTKHALGTTKIVTRLPNSVTISLFLTITNWRHTQQSPLLWTDTLLTQVLSLFFKLLIFWFKSSTSFKCLFFYSSTLTRPSSSSSFNPCSFTQLSCFFSFESSSFIWLLKCFCFDISSFTNSFSWTSNSFSLDSNSFIRSTSWFLLTLTPSIVFQSASF